jgi:hypothetical protein
LSRWWFCLSRWWFCLRGDDFVGVDGDFVWAIDYCV